MTYDPGLNSAIIIFNGLTVESDEDSALGMAYVSGRISEDMFYIAKKRLEELAVTYKSLTEQNNRYREALERISKIPSFNQTELEMQKIAREALS